MNDRKVFRDSVVPLPESEGLSHTGLLINAAEPEHRAEPMTVLFNLPLQGEEQLEELVARGEVAPPAQQKEYTSKATDREALLKWLQEQGFEISQVSADGTSVYATARVDQIEKSLAVHMARITKDGITYTAARDAPSLPIEIGEGVRAIIGLQPFRQMQKHSRKYLAWNGDRTSLGTMTRTSTKRGARKASSRKGGGNEIPAPASAASPSPNIQNAPPYLVQEILKAYGADGLSVSGKGQTIAILIDTFPNDSDLQAFWKRNSLPLSLKQIEKINVNNGQLPPPEGEETLDVAWASGIAPGAKIRIYATGSLNFVDLDRALDRIIADLPSQPQMRQLSISLGLGETFMGGRDGEVAVQRQKFLRLAAAGVNVFVSSGDAGSNPDDRGHSSTGPTQAEYESSDTSVIGVGGTTLTLGMDGTITSETGWSGSGGGKSMFFARPVWQTGVGIPQGHERLVPDVSLAADPNKGAFLVFQGKPIQIGGTSWSAPVWAGFCALINEARAQAKKPLLPFLNPLIYPLMGSASFRDIQTGSNGAFSAGAGYDLVTGIGVPNLKELIRTLTL